MNRLCIIAVFAFLSFNALAQSKEPIIFTFGPDTVFRSEFERVYSKNNDVKTKKPTEKEIQEYLDLYVKFKLKVKEAYSCQMDTSSAFISELAGYRKQLAQPYLVDNQVTDQLIVEAYNRLLEEVNVSHILIACAKDDLPKDTLMAFKKISEIRKQIVEDKISFDSAARQKSDDPSARVNFGLLGYFSAFQMIYPFENMAFNTPKGQLSLVFRTQFGYHILKVNDRRLSPGEIKVAHIMIRFNNDKEVAGAKEKIDAIYTKLQQGENFEEMVKQYSEDFSTKANKGEMTWFKSTGQLPPDFKEAAFALKKDGDYSAPVKTDFGWHIIKRLEVKGIAPLTDQKENLKYKVSRDERSQISSKVVLERFKKENKFTPNTPQLDKFITTVDTSLLRGSWLPGEKSKTSAVLFTIADQSYTFEDFSTFIMNFQTPKKTDNVGFVVKDFYNDYVEKMNFAYEEDHLEEKYPDFKNLMQEYRDGILLFELTDKMVWGKAVEDTLGLKAYYELNKTKYMWGTRADAAIFVCSDASVAKAVKKLVKKNLADTTIYRKINAKDPLAVNITRGKFEKGQNETIDKIAWKVGVIDLPEALNKVSFVKIYNVMPAAPKELKEIMGMATSDYQAYLEDTWIKELKAKYPVTFNKDGIELLFK
ncbi:MAG: peptidylprolyl isomerase [Bacteroidia bacterium]